MQTRANKWRGSCLYSAYQPIGSAGLDLILCLFPLATPLRVVGHITGLRDQFGVTHGYASRQLLQPGGYASTPAHMGSSSEMCVFLNYHSFLYQCKKICHFKTQCKGDISHASKTAKISVFDPVMSVATRGCLPPGRTSLSSPSPPQSDLKLILVTTMALVWTVNSTQTCGCFLRNAMKLRLIFDFCGRRLHGHTRVVEHATVELLGQ